MKSSSASLSDVYRRLAWGWLAVVSLLVVLLALLLPRARLDSSVLSLLPASSLGKVPPQIENGFLQRLDKQMMWMVSPGNQPDAAAAQWWQTQLQQQPFLQDVQGPMEAKSQQEWGKFYFENRNGLLDNQTRSRLQNGGEAQVQWVLSQLYSAFSGVSGKELTNDPLMLVRGSQLALQQTASQMRLQNGWLVARDKQGRYWYLLHGELKGSSFDMQQGRVAVEQLRALQQKLKSQFPDAQVMSRGTLFYSDYASQQAKHDVSTLGLATVIGVLLLVLLVFRSLRPLLLCATSVAIGALAGTAITLLCFGELHLMTLVMSMSIVGVSADYTLYYLTERMVHGAQNSPSASLRKVLPALLLALATTAIAYLIMILAPFPGIRQLAVFAASGLIASCLTVVCWYPFAVRGLPVRPVPCSRLLNGWLNAWQNNKAVRFGIPLALLVISLAGVVSLKINDDIASFQALPQDLVREEQAITALTGQGMDQKWFVVYGDTAEQTLQRLEKLAPVLASAQKNKLIDSYRLIPLASLEQQQADLRLLREAAPVLQKRLAESGITVSAPNLQQMAVTPELWQKSVISSGWRLLWLTLPDGKSGALVPVSGVRDSAALAGLAAKLPGVSWVDRKVMFNELFSHFRSLLAGLLAAAVAAIALSYVLRLGVKRGLLSVVPSLLSLGGGLAALAFSGHALNLFSLLALVLVLGIGINYTLFFSNPRGTALTSLLAISVALLTTLFTLGMLVFSQTQAIASFGIVLSCGIFCAFLTAPLALPPSTQGKGKRE
ncbi:membrane protein [Buttiauxella ferragutiae ATCC 51602]|uniref:Membrane protein n=1 Tax=Buttiauxella ferragutiae ATCC 51602 TaxID=1354252 RepID=A0ABX2W3W8_9ENTR|nr:MMPL family transporter [Buttiauxella ferragutiae]OAT25313.1 membrane protein [Buttiauxella ferragutiae ATCC 51602]